VSGGGGVPLFPAQRSLRRAVAGLKGCEKVRMPPRAVCCSIFRSIPPGATRAIHSPLASLAHSLACIPGDLTQSTLTPCADVPARRLQNAHQQHAARTILYYVYQLSSASIVVRCNSSNPRNGSTAFVVAK
jgi:hypothetical protein